jgi:NDP-4-keto-2,6-dideoxyhexose 3-C-methyltransferase
MKHKETILDLGELYVSEFVKDISNTHVGLKFPLKLVWDDTLYCPVLSEQPPNNMMWGKYWYRSGINPQMVLDLRDVVKSINKILPPPSERGKIWVDIASNDGTLLKEVPHNYMKVGIDPCTGDIAELCRENSNMLVQDYFTEEAYNTLDLWDKASVITCCAMFYDLKYPLVFLEDVFNVLRDDGIFVMQYTYTPTMLGMGDFMNICHEHYAYHYFENVYDMMKVSGLSVFRVEKNDVNGGSIRIYADKGEHTVENSVIELLEKERRVDKAESWKMFKQVIEMNRFKIVNFIKEQNQKGDHVWGYGASTKGNTLLQWYGLDGDDIFRIADANKTKEGRYTKGSGVKICSEKEWRDANPKYTLIMPFHFKEFFFEKEKEYLANGGTFIIPCPMPMLVTKDGEEYL